jgi:autophagy-related protein 13
VVLDESDELLKYIMRWRTAKIEEERPPPLIIEIYLDLAELTRSQSLVVIDDQGKRWDVAEALGVSAASNARASSRSGINAQVTLERWEIELDDTTEDSVVDKDGLAVVYKRSIPLFRSLYTYTRQLPAFKFYRRTARQPAGQPTLTPKYRVLIGPVKNSRTNTLEVPLLPTDENVTEHYAFEPLQCPAGSLGISVTYRTKCEFRVDDSESLLSSHFMGLDDHYFKPSLPGRLDPAAQLVPSSVPTSRREYLDEGRDQGQVYGSMSTFHKTGAAMGASPISTLRARTDEGASPSAATPPQKVPPNQRFAQGSKSSQRSEMGLVYPRRGSVSFQPFKAGSLAYSPVSGSQVPPSPSSSVGRPSTLTSGFRYSPASGSQVPPSPSSSLRRPSISFKPFAPAQNRNSLTTLPQAALRTPSLPNETAIASSTSSSPKPAPINRYSSSFSHRRSRFSHDGGSKGEPDQGSSGKPSPSSSTQPGSDLINEGQGGSSDSVPQTDDDNLKGFIQLLEQKKDLKSFRNDSAASRDASMRRTTAALSKYQRMRESHTQLTDSMSSSLLLHRSSSSSSRQLSSVPPMIHGTSVSTSSSPGKPISPHTPHTPAIPSRLSAGSVAEYSQPRRSRSQPRRDVEPMREESSSDSTARDTGTIAIDIPTSPRAWAYSRRSSSVSQQQQRALDEEPDPYGIRSASLPPDERTELSMSELLRVADDGTVTGPPAEDDRFPDPDTDSTNLQAYPFPTNTDSRQKSSSRPSSVADHVLPLRTRLSRGGRGSPSFSSSERGSRYGTGSRTSAQAPEEDDMIFHLSELGTGSRRSLEEGRGGGASGTSAEKRRGGGSSSPWQ